MSAVRLDWRRILRRSAIGLIGAFALWHLYLTASGPNFGPDFHGGAWLAGRALLNGQSPYLRADPHLLLAHTNSFVTPPVLAVLAAPYSMLPFGVAIILWNLSCVAALVAALWLLGVREVPTYILCLASVPVVDSLELGQPDAILLLACALAWRFRDSRIGAVALGGLIAAKLLALPLLIWLVATRRFRACGLAIASAAIFLAASWALIGFQGLAQYPRLLAADAKAFEAWPLSLSLPGAAIHFGASARLATLAAFALAAIVGAAVVLRGKRADSAWFGAGLATGLLVSPIMWWHYLVILFVPAAIARRRTLTLWLIPSWGLWVVFLFLHPSGQFRALLAIGTVVVVALVACRDEPVAPAVARGRPAGHGHGPIAVSPAPVGGQPSA